MMQYFTGKYQIMNNQRIISSLSSFCTSYWHHKLAGLSLIGQDKIADIDIIIFLKSTLHVTLTLHRGGQWGRCAKTYLPRRKEAMDGEIKPVQHARGAGAQTWDLPRARRESPDARHGHCLDK